MNNGKIAQKTPYVLASEAKKYAWCSCGESKNQPYCDGTHKGTEFTPVIVNITEAKTVVWCGCKQSGNKPFCDGSHAKL